MHFLDNNSCEDRRTGCNPFGCSGRPEQHLNSELLNKFTEDEDGELLFDGHPVGTGVSTAHGLPAGGALGQVLAKKTAADYDVLWKTISGGGGGGATDQSFESLSPTVTSSPLSGYPGIFLFLEMVAFHDAATYCTQIDMTGIGGVNAGPSPDQTQPFFSRPSLFLKCATEDEWVGERILLLDNRQNETDSLVFFADEWFTQYTIDLGIDYSELQDEFNKKYLFVRAGEALMLRLENRADASTIDVYPLHTTPTNGVDGTPYGYYDGEDVHSFPEGEQLSASAFSVWEARQNAVTRTSLNQTEALLQTVENLYFDLSMYTFRAGETIITMKTQQFNGSFRNKSRVIWTKLDIPDTTYMQGLSARFESIMPDDNWPSYPPLPEQEIFTKELIEYVQVDGDNRPVWTQWACEHSLDATTPLVGNIYLDLFHDPDKQNSRDTVVYSCEYQGPYPGNMSYFLRVSNFKTLYTDFLRLQEDLGYSMPEMERLTAKAVKFDNSMQNQIFAEGSLVDFDVELITPLGISLVGFSFQRKIGAGSGVFDIEHQHATEIPQPNASWEYVPDREPPSGIILKPYKFWSSFRDPWDPNVRFLDTYFIRLNGIRYYYTKSIIWSSDFATSVRENPLAPPSPLRVLTETPGYGNHSYFLRENGETLWVDLDKENKFDGGFDEKSLLKSDATLNIEYPLFVNGTQYHLNDIVYYLDKGFVCSQNNPTDAPMDDDFNTSDGWTPIADRYELSTSDTPGPVYKAFEDQIVVGGYTYTPVVDTPLELNCFNEIVRLQIPSKIKDNGIVPAAPYPWVLLKNIPGDGVFEVDFFSDSSIKWNPSSVFNRSMVYQEAIVIDELKWEDSMSEQWFFKGAKIVYNQNPNYSMAYVSVDDGLVQFSPADPNADPHWGFVDDVNPIYGQTLKPFITFETNPTLRVPTIYIRKNGVQYYAIADVLWTEEQWDALNPDDPPFPFKAVKNKPGYGKWGHFLYSNGFEEWMRLDDNKTNIFQSRYGDYATLFSVQNKLTYPTMGYSTIGHELYTGNYFNYNNRSFVCVQDHVFAFEDMATPTPYELGSWAMVDDDYFGVGSDGIWMNSYNPENEPVFDPIYEGDASFGTNRILLLNGFAFVFLERIALTSTLLAYLQKYTQPWRIQELGHIRTPYPVVPMWGWPESAGRENWYTWSVDANNNNYRWSDPVYSNKIQTIYGYFNGSDTISFSLGTVPVEQLRNIQIFCKIQDYTWEFVLPNVWDEPPLPYPIKKPANLRTNATTEADKLYMTARRPTRETVTLTYEFSGLGGPDVAWILCS